MDQYFREALEGLKACAQHMMAASQFTAQASEQINLAGAELVKVTAAALHARDEHEDLRETVHRLEGTVLDLVKEVRELREGRR